MEKWDDRKWRRDRKVGRFGGEKVERWKTLLCGWGEKWENGKGSLYKCTLMPLLHNI